jgi:hypothetical protein
MQVTVPVKLGWDTRLASWLPDWLEKGDLKFEIRVNDFLDLLDERDEQNVQIFHTIKEAR